MSNSGMISQPMTSNHPWRWPEVQPSNPRATRGGLAALACRQPSHFSASCRGQRESRKPQNADHGDAEEGEDSSAAKHLAGHGSGVTLTEDHRDPAKRLWKSWSQRWQASNVVMKIAPWRTRSAGHFRMLVCQPATASTNFHHPWNPCSEVFMKRRLWPGQVQRGCSPTRIQEDWRMPPVSQALSLRHGSYSCGAIPATRCCASS